ncbi:hydrogen gas-evolving membrane-bound hydrogenase subunit E [Candidatus Deianiraea vastatrix]|uniref:Cation transporter MnhB-like subunit n=1 Tax=Candidatus Deianiraea vastatrix TaxID=2163644 RepID=A0A5B8XEL3_9RICK|nr:hydrogen gas-evolving membrane-bound hydrogenase subunit E [Candidatus Deianiraea vastatrix]QED23748.1 Putative cation transporter MnhB-like subunit [Candidatus Deianiraea vastatrix]
MLFFNYLMIMALSVSALIVSFIVIFSSTIVSVFAYGILSLFLTTMYLVLCAPDVAITEAAVGSAISTMFFLMAIRAIENNISHKQKHEKKERIKISLKNATIVKSSIVFCLFVLMIYIGVSDAFIEIGKLGNAVNFESSNYYIEHSYQETGVKNIVTSVLASYRGFDTLVENLVIMTSAIGVYFILKTKDAEEDVN